VYDDRITQGLRLNTTYPLTLECGASEEILFKRTTTESARIDSSGRLLIGTSTALTAFFGTTANRLAIGGGAAPQVLGCYSTNQFGPRFDFIKSRSATVNGQAIVSIDDRLGELNFGGSDGTAPIPAARIICQVDGTPGTNDMPGRLVFFTTADGASSPTERLRIDSSGNVGIGTTNPSQKLEVSGNTSIIGGGFLLMQNTNRIQWGSSGTAYIAGQDGGSGYLALGTVGSERARIDSSGRLLVGTSSALDASAGRQLQVADANGAYLILGRDDTTVGDGPGLGGIHFYGNDTTSNAWTKLGSIDCSSDGTQGAGDNPTRLVFSTTADGASTPTGRMRISSEGRTDAFGTSETLRVRTAATTAAASIAIRLQAGATSITAGGTTEFQVTSNGNVANTTNSYGAISDIKLKENIVDANSQWNDLKALQVRNYNFKEGQTHTQIGLVAQEAELVSPGLVNESPDHDAEGNDLGTVTKSVNYSVLYMKAVKALQEAMERIETFEQRLSDAGIA
jgi:hypothetical protein